MQTKTRGRGSWTAFAIVCGVGCALAGTVLSVQRPIILDVPKTFVANRPRAKKPSQNAKIPAYQLAANESGKAAPTKAEAGSQVGVTLWRLQPSKPTDQPGARLFVQPEEKDEKPGVELTPVRSEAGEAMPEGALARFTVESPRTGYMYIVDREQYADGSFGTPYLIFPTSRTRGGDNAVKAGAPIEIPSQSDRVPYFELKRSRPDHVGEALTVIVTPTPIADLKIGRNAQALSPEQFAKWEAQWSAPFTRFEMVGGSGTAYTAAEKTAGGGGSDLTDEDPLPQTIYNLAAKPGAPILLTIPVRILG